MAAKLADLREWFERGVSQGSTHMVVVCDTFNYEDYPVYVEKGQNPHDVVKEKDNPNQMSKVMEVYDLRQPADDQLKPGILVFNYGDDFPPQEESPIDTWF